MRILLFNIGVPNYPVRLVSNTGNESNGIVQIYHERTWGSICNFTQFSPNDARVVCKSLGFTLGPHCPSGTCGTTLPSSSLIPVWSSSLNCDGSSVSLSDCGTVFGAHSCSYHTQDVNLVCICELCSFLGGHVAILQDYSVLHV